MGIEGMFGWLPVFSAGVPRYRLYSGHMNGKSDDYYSRGGWITFFEQMQQLHGFNATMMDLAEDRKQIYQLRDDLLAFNMDWLDRWLAGDYQGLHFADDVPDDAPLIILLRNEMDLHPARPEVIAERQRALPSLRHARSLQRFQNRRSVVIADGNRGNVRLVAGLLRRRAQVPALQRPHERQKR